MIFCSRKEHFCPQWVQPQVALDGHTARERPNSTIGLSSLRIFRRRTANCAVYRMTEEQLACQWYTISKRTQIHRIYFMVDRIWSNSLAIIELGHFCLSSLWTTSATKKIEQSLQHTPVSLYRFYPCIPLQPCATLRTLCKGRLAWVNRIWQHMVWPLSGILFRLGGEQMVRTRLGFFSISKMHQGLRILDPLSVRRVWYTRT